MPVRRTHLAHRSGFTLMELCVVVAIIGILAALALEALGAVREMNSIELAPRQFSSMLQVARLQASATGRDVVVVIVGNGGAADAPRCTQANFDPARCVRYWLLEDIVDGTSTRFDDASLGTFDPDSPAGLGDRVLDADVLPDHVYIGRHASYVPPVVDSDSELYADIPLDDPCSFCDGSTPPRGYVRFRPDGIVQLGNTAPSARAGVIFFNVATSDGPIPRTRFVTILQPAGLISEGLSAAHP